MCRFGTWDGQDRRVFHIRTPGFVLVIVVVVVMKPATFAAHPALPVSLPPSLQLRLRLQVQERSGRGRRRGDPPLRLTADSQKPRQEPQRSVKYHRGAVVFRDQAFRLRSASSADSGVKCCSCPRPIARLLQQIRRRTEQGMGGAGPFRGRSGNVQRAVRTPRGSVSGLPLSAFSRLRDLPPAAVEAPVPPPAWPPPGSGSWR